MSDLVSDLVAKLLLTENAEMFAVSCFCALLAIAAPFPHSKSVTACSVQILAAVPKFSVVP